MPPRAEAYPLRAIFRFWLPLALTWLIMAVEGPFLAAVIARLADPKFNLAAYGVALAFAMLVEAPVIMMMSASTALVDSWQAFRRLWKFSLALNAGITALMLLILVPPVFHWLCGDLIGLEPEVERLTRSGLVLLLPWPAAIGYRRFYQGLMIRSGRTRRVAYGTLVRLGAMAATALLLARHGGISGAIVGAAALSAGVCGEAVASRFMAMGALRDLRASRFTAAGTQANPGAGPVRPQEAALDYGTILRFYTPLAMTMVLTLAVQPLVTFFMGQAEHSLESLAVLPVVMSLVFVFRTPGVSFQEAAIALLGQDRRRLGSIIRFTGILAAGASVGLAAIAWTPLAQVWFRRVSGLTPELAAFALAPARILVLLPALAALLSLQRALLIDARRTRPVTVATLIEMLGVFGLLALTVHGFKLTGVTAAAISIMIGRIAGNLYLLPACLPACRAATTVPAAAAVDA